MVASLCAHFFNRFVSASFDLSLSFFFRHTSTGQLRTVDEEILEAYNTLSGAAFRRRAASIAEELGGPSEEVEMRARHLNNSPQKKRSSPRGSKGRGKSSKDDEDMPKSNTLTGTEQEFAWLMEEYFFLHPTAKKKLAFWFVELHASDEFGEEIKDRQDSMSEVQWKKAGKVNIFVKKSRLEEFHRFREAVRQKLRSGYVRDRMKDPFEERDAASSAGAPGTPRGLSVSFSQENDDDEFDETGVFPKSPIDIKPKHKKGDRVFAAWIDNLLEDGELSWFAGTIKGYSVTEKRGHYGEGRVYHVEFDDGDVDTNLKDVYVMSEKDYYLVEKGYVANNSSSGISKISGVGDEYAETVGWYKTSYTGEKVFGLLSDAVRARDSKVVERKGQYVTEADLIFPDDWDFPSQFASRVPLWHGRGTIEFDDDNIINGDSETESRSRVSPRKQPSAKASNGTGSNDDDESSRRVSGNKHKQSKRSTENGGGHKRHKRAHSHHSTKSSEHQSEEEEVLKYDLAVAYRLCANLGCANLGSLHQTHISVRYATDCLACDNFKVWSSIAPSDISVLPTEFDIIHHAIYKQREDVGAIVHLKSPAATAVSCLQNGFQFLSFDSAPFHKKLATCDCSGTGKAMEKNFASAIGAIDDCNVLMLRNNGFACFAKTIHEAWLLAQRFEECCKVQLEVMKSGGGARYLSDKDFKQAIEAGIAQASIPTSIWNDLSASVME